ncbi:MAG: hypothetical protein HON65_11110 [Rhodospirillales bacterium]|nr:hypothetical protein [Rhodospirillales bacterium]
MQCLHDENRSDVKDWNSSGARPSKIQSAAQSTLVAAKVTPLWDVAAKAPG